MTIIKNRRVLMTALFTAALSTAALSNGRNDCRMTGGGSIFDTIEVTYDGRTTHGFELHCDTRNPNNLQINWEGNRFHLLDLTGAVCPDDPTIEPNPPDASFDTFIGIGNGRLNGTPGYQIAFTFTDAGEPGTSDTADIVITSPGGDTVLSVQGPLTFGNHQAHGR